ncbi:MAG: DUF4159 domain-containing protein, partial [Paracoccaceae bacterium]|nr:DUF4159 domain-containing protein [Paracoccaceae bacterium]
VPPAPVRRIFAGVSLLIGLRDDDVQTDRTPLWLLLLRSLMVASAILGFAGPFLKSNATEPSSRPLLIVLDATWASAPEWQAQTQFAANLLDQAARSGRVAAVSVLSEKPQGAIGFSPASRLTQTVSAMEPRPWLLSQRNFEDWQAALPEEAFDTVWLSDGLAYDDRLRMLEALTSHGDVTVHQGQAGVVALTQLTFKNGQVQVSATRSHAAMQADYVVTARGPDPSGIERELARAPLSFAAGATTITVEFSLPVELRNRLARVEIDGLRSAGAKALSDDSLKRRKVGILSTQAEKEALRLLSPSHYIEKALTPTADILKGAVSDLLPANPDVIVLADVAQLTPLEREGLQEWVERGGTLLRFAGPRMAAGNTEAIEEELLLPVRLRAGGRSMDGSMSWGEPKTLRAFERSSPFYGLPVPADVHVNTQVVAEPAPEVSERTIASLTDGTPLVTRKDLGAGQVVLFHVTANAQWSNLPLSGLFVQMLERLSISSPAARPTAEDLKGTRWQPVDQLDAFGDPSAPNITIVVAGEDLVTKPAHAQMPPGVYEGALGRIAVNAMEPDRALRAADWPRGIEILSFQEAISTDLGAPLLLLALILLAADIVATLALSGTLTMSARSTTSVLAVTILMTLPPQESRAQDDSIAIEATSQVALAHVLTGVPEVDAIARAGLIGLSDTLYRRTSVEPGMPLSVDLEQDELAYFPLLYWPITSDQPQPSPATYEKLNRYLRNGGMILFDTRDAGFGSARSEEAQTLIRLTRFIDVPALEPVPEDHILTRTFYLLRDFPGRFTGGTTWIEAALPGATQADGMPFRNLNDNVSPVIIGGNDWAAAWAVDTSGNWMFPV